MDIDSLHNSRGQDVDLLEEYIQIRNETLYRKQDEHERRDFLEKVINECKDDDLKMLLRLLWFDTVSLINPMKDHDYDDILNLLQESEVSKQEGEQQSIVKEVIRLKSYDVHTDRVFLHDSAPKSFRLTELLTKKLTALNNSWLSDEQLVSTLGDVYVKVIEYTLIADSDFKRRKILVLLDDFIRSKVTNSQLCIEDRLDANTKKLFDLLLGNKFVPYDLYISFLQGAKVPAVQYLTQHKQILLLTNVLEYNISLLPKYYETIYYDRIVKLFKLPEEIEKGIGVETVIAKMIENEKLPPNTRINQIERSVVFGQSASNGNQLDTHIQQVCEVVDNLSNTIHASGR